jgi:GH24 family phage-related lysozyme (muramidase)
MKRLLLLMWFVVLVVSAGATNSFTAMMELPPFERACRIVKYYETNHIDRWPVIGYGHVVQPGEPFVQGINLTDVQADSLLRQDLTKLCQRFEQYDASSAVLLACLAYNCGPQKVLHSELLRKVERGETDVAAEYLSFCHYRGKVHAGLQRRRYVEYWLLHGRNANLEEN